MIAATSREPISAAIHHSFEGRSTSSSGNGSASAPDVAGASTSSSSWAGSGVTFSPAFVMLISYPDSPGGNPPVGDLALAYCGDFSLFGELSLANRRRPPRAAVPSEFKARETASR